MKKILLPKHPRHPTRHPLLELETYAEANDVSLRQIAKRDLKMTQQQLHKMMVAARKSRHYLVTPRHVPAISALLDIPPYFFNPVLWPTTDWKFPK